ncbi:ribonuclease H-like domain-containing protein [Colletotrichum cereale]|nr:ribonuclease H-like domain-containing protein [Colletotrichum cereale]
MDVNMENFGRQLPQLLMSIATSQFVTIDLEMTGITDRNLEERHGDHGRQQTYEAAKAIASNFNVFDLGITCIMAQPDGSYEVESYSFTVSPYLHSNTRDDETFFQDVDRRLCIAYNTLKFLRKEGVRMGKMYEDCVSYLSLKDVRKASQRMEKRMEPRGDREHPYNEDDEGLSLFSVHVWDTINNWLKDSAIKRSTEIEILIPRSDSKKRTSIYHQIVRRVAQVLVPHMRCRIWNYGATVVIYPVYKNEENEKRKLLQDRLATSLRKYSGIRLVIEALAGGDAAELIDADRVVDAFSACPGDAQIFCQKVRQMLQSTSPTHSRDASEDENDDSEGEDVHVTPQPTDDWSFDHPPAFSFPRQAISPGDRPPKTLETPGLDRPQQNINVYDGWGSWTSQMASDNHENSCGSHEESTDWEEVCTGDEELPAESLGHEVAQAFKMIEGQLKKSRPVIVGYNQFMDLLFLYTTFIDDLPDALDDFLAEIYGLFPCIIDTKLLAIKDQVIEGEDPLLDLYSRLSNRNAMPQMCWHTAYGYGRNGAAHQAGFDSYMTAAVFLRLAYKLACKNLTGDKGEETGRELMTLYSSGCWLSGATLTTSRTREPLAPAGRSRWMPTKREFVNPNGTIPHLT